ncbi:M28 family peptidase [Chitinimonas naiadis]
MSHPVLRCSVVLLLLPALQAWAAGPQTPIRPEALLAYTQVLSSDAFEGRAPGTAGETATVNYLTEQFKALGLEPGNPDGSYVQKVPLAGISTRTSLSLGGCGKSLQLREPVDYVAGSTQLKDKVATADSELVFVGYGIDAPEYGWDDYKGVDVRGKTLLMLIGDPPIPDPKRPGKLDARQFKGPAMTYYGRWTYKYEVAAAKGAAGAIIIHETAPAGYGWFVVMNGWNRERYVVRSADGNAGELAVRSWLRLDHAQSLLKGCGQDFDALKLAALRRDFRPIVLGGQASFTLEQTLRELESQNVVAKLGGNDPQRKDEWLVYSAHWDHLGRSGDQIYHGAADNALGVAGLLELARAYQDAAKAGKRPGRSLLFLAPTAEESGLLGARYYVQHPLYPLAQTVADINMDIVNSFGPTRDIGVVGLGQSDMDDRLRRAAAPWRRKVVEEAAPQNGMYYRADHFEFARVGIPVLYTNAGVDYIGKPAAFGKQKAEAYIANDYHKPSDVVKPDWDLRGAAQDLGLLYQVGRELVDGKDYPRFAGDSEFKARQDALKQGR